MKEPAKTARAEWKRVYARLPWLLMIPLGLIVPRLLTGQTAFVETYYTGKVYAAIKDAISAVTSLVPFSVAELLLYAVVLTAALSFIIDLLRVLFRRAPLVVLINRIVSIAVSFGALLLMFYATWGLNYFRAPLKERMALNVCARPIDELELLTETLAARANELRVSLPEDEGGVAVLEDGYRKVFDTLPEAYVALAEKNGVFSGKVTRAKAVAWSKGLSWCGITGVYIGITAEPNVNVNAPAFLLPHTAAHEMAHQLGVASEDEAEFAGYLACMNSVDPSVRYAGTVTMLIHCGNALYDRDAERYAAIFDGYSEALKRDLRFQHTYWDAYEGKLEEQAEQVNDAYLKHNGQESGVDSYGEVVDMLLAYRELTDF